jgi:hypothetical protein
MSQQACHFVSSGLQISIENKNILSISADLLSRLNISLDGWIGKDIDCLIGSITDRPGIIEPCEILLDRDLGSKEFKDWFVYRQNIDSHTILYLHDASEAKQIYCLSLRSPVPISAIRKMPSSIPDYILDSQYILKDSICLNLDPLGVIQSVFPFHPCLGVTMDSIIGLPITAFIHPEDHVLLMQCWSECIKSKVQGNIIVRWNPCEVLDIPSQLKWIQVQSTPGNGSVVLVLQHLAPLTVPAESWSLSNTLSSLTSTYFKSTSLIPQQKIAEEKGDNRMYAIIYVA